MNSSNFGYQGHKNSSIKIYSTSGFLSIFIEKGTLQAGIAGELLTSVGGAAIDNLIDSVKKTVFGGDKGIVNNDRPGVALATPVLSYGSFGLYSGNKNTGVDLGMQCIAYSDSDRANIVHNTWHDLLTRPFMINTFSQTTSDVRGTELFGMSLDLQPIPTTNVSNMVASHTPMSALAPYFSYWTATIRMTITTVATDFDRTTLVMSFVYGTNQTPSLVQASNQLSQTIELDGSGKSYTLEIPYVSPYPMLRTKHGEGVEGWNMYHLGHFSALVVTNLTSNGAIVGPEVKYIVSMQVVDYDFKMAATTSNTPLLPVPIHLKDPPIEFGVATARFDPNYIPSVRGRLQASSGMGIGDGNTLIATTRSSAVVNPTTIGGTLIPSYGDMLARDNIVSASLHIDQFTEIGAIKAMSFMDLVSVQGRTALTDFNFLSFNKGATMKLNILVQGNPTVKGAIAMAIYPFTTPEEALQRCSGLVSLSMPQGTILLQLNKTDSVNVEIPLSTMMGGTAAVASLNDYDTCPFSVVFYMITGYLGTAETTPIIINFRSSVTGVTFSTPHLVVDDSSTNFIATTKGRFQSGVVDQIDDTHVIADKPQSVPTVATTSMPKVAENVEQSFNNSWRLLVDYHAPEMGDGTLKGSLGPIVIPYTVPVIGCEISPTTSYPVQANLSILPAERALSPQPSGFTNDQCIFARAIPGCELWQCFRFLQYDMMLAIKLRTKSGKGAYKVEVIYNTSFLHGGNYPLPNNDAGQYAQGTVGQCFGVVCDDEWTTVLAPFYSMFGTAKTPSTYAQAYDPVCCPYVIRISTEVRKGPVGGTVMPVPSSMGFQGYNKYLDFDLSSIEIYFRMGENTTASIPIGVPTIWTNPNQSEGKYSQDRPTASVPGMIQVTCSVAAGTAWPQSRQEVVDAAIAGMFRTTAVGKPYDPNEPNEYFTSRQLTHFYVQTLSLQYSQINTILGTTYSANTEFVSDGTVFPFETSTPFLQMPMTLSVEILAQSGSAGALNEGLDDGCFVRSDYNWIPPGTMDSYVSQILLNAQVYARNPWMAAGYIPASFAGNYIIPSNRDQTASHLVGIDSGLPIPIPDTDLQVVNVYDIGGGNKKGVLLGSEFFQSDLDVPEIVEGKLESFKSLGIDLVPGQLQMHNGKQYDDYRPSHSSVQVSSSSMSSQNGTCDPPGDDDCEGDSDSDEPPDLVDDEFVVFTALATATVTNNDWKNASPEFENKQNACNSDEQCESGDNPGSDADRERKTNDLCDRMTRLAFSMKDKVKVAGQRTAAAFKKFWKSPGDEIKLMFTDFIRIVSSAASMARDKIEENIFDPIGSVKKFFNSYLAKIPAFVVVLCVIFVVSEFLNTDYMKTTFVPWILTPLAKIVGAVCGKLSTSDNDTYNGWFWDSFRSVKDRFSKSYHWCKSLLSSKDYGENVGEFLADAEEQNVPVEHEEPKEATTFGSKISHWVAVLVDSFSLHTLQKLFGKACVSAAASLSLMVWMEKRCSSASKMLEFFGRIAPSWYTYVTNLLCNSHSAALAAVHNDIEFINQCMYSGPRSPFMLDKKHLLSMHIRNVARHFAHHGHTLAKSDVTYITKLLTEARRLEATQPADSQASDLRTKPVLLCFCGPAGIGKSTLTSWLLSRFAPNAHDIAWLNLGADTRIESNMYSGQSIANISEIFPINDTQCRLAQIDFIMKYVETSPNTVASAFDKGEVQFHPIFTVTTTNYNWTKPIAEVTDLGALLRRIVIMKCRVKDDWKNPDGTPKIDTSGNFRHLEIAPVVDATPYVNNTNSRVGSDTKFSYPGAPANSPVRVGKETGLEFVPLQNGVSCPAHMSPDQLVGVITELMDANQRSFNVMLSVMTNQEDATVDPFIKDMNEVFSNSEATRRTTMCKAILKALILDFMMNDRKSVNPTVADVLNFLAGTWRESKSFLGMNQGHTSSDRRVAGAIAVKVVGSGLLDNTAQPPVWAPVEALISSFSREELSFCMKRLRSFDSTDAPATSYQASTLSHKQVINELANQQGQHFIKKYLLANLFNTPVDVSEYKMELKEAADDYWYLSMKKKGKWVRIKKSSEFWFKFSARVNAFCALVADGSYDGVQNGTTIPVGRSEVVIAQRPLHNPFSHGFWCSKKGGCDCAKRKANGFGSTLANLATTAWDNPFHALAVGFIAWRTAHNFLQITKTVKSVVGATLATSLHIEPGLVPQRRDFAGAQFDGDVPGRDKPGKLEYVFMFDDSKFTIQHLHQIVEQHVAGGIDGSINSCAIRIVEAFADALFVEHQEVVDSFRIFCVRRQTFVALGWFPVNVLGTPVSVGHLNAYVRGVLRWYEEDQRETRNFMGEIELEAGDLESKTTRNRRRQLSKHQKLSKPSVTRGQLQSGFAGITKEHELQRLRIMQDGVVKISVRPSGTSVYQTAHGFNVGMRQVAMNLHLLAADDCTLGSKTDYNQIAEFMDMIIVDERNFNTICSVAHTQFTPLRSFNGQVEVDVGLLNLGNGAGLRKQVKLFAKRSMFDKTVQFENVLLLVGQGDPIDIGRVIVKPQHTTAMEKEDGSLLKYIHSGVLLYRPTGLDMTGYCGCVYVAKMDGNWWIIGMHVGLQYDLKRQGLPEGSWQCGVILCQDMFESAFPVEVPKVVKKATIPNYPEIDSDEEAWYPDTLVAEDREFISEASQTKSFVEAYEGKHPVAQYVGRYGKARLISQKSGIVDSPVASMTGTRHLFEVAYQGEKASVGFPSTLEMLKAGLDRSTYTGKNIPGAAYDFVNDHLRSAIAGNPPVEPLKTHVTLRDVINGGFSTGTTVDPSTILTSTLPSVGHLRFNGIDASASAGVPGSGLKQIDFLCEVKDEEGNLIRMIDHTTPNGQMAMKALQTILERFMDGKCVWMLFSVVLKDEALQLAKVKPWLKEIFPVDFAAKGGKTRIITCLFFAFNIALKMFLLPVATYLKSLGTKIDLVTGRDSYSPDFQEVVRGFYSIQAGKESFIGADVSDQESRIDTNTYSGFIGLTGMVYLIQSKLWCHKRGQPWEDFRNRQRSHPHYFSDTPRVAAISSCLPSGNLVGSKVYYMCMRNQSGSYLTSLISWYYTEVSEVFSLHRGYELARLLVSKSKYAKDHDLAYVNPTTMRVLLASGDDQLARYSDQLLRLFADANRLLAQAPVDLRRYYPVPVELDVESSDQRNAGSYVQACTYHFCGLPLVNPDDGGNCVFTSRSEVTFLGNYITENPQLSALLAKRGVLVSTFAVLRDVSRTKCLNFLRLSGGDDPIAPLCQNFNSVLELTFTSGRDAFELCRCDLLDMMYHIDVEFPLVTFDACFERFVSKDYTLGDDANVFPIH